MESGQQNKMKDDWLIVRASSLGIKCVYLLGISFHTFSSLKLIRQRKCLLHIVMKKIDNFHVKSELPTFILLVKIGWLIFSQFLGWK